MARCTWRRDQGGYTLVEFSLALGLMSMIAIGAYPQLARALEERALRGTALGFDRLTTLALRYRQRAHGQWPSAPSQLASLMDSTGSLTVRNAFGGAYEFEVDGDRFAILSDVGSAHRALRLRDMLGPLASINASELRVWVPMPGEEISRSHFVRRNRADENAAMHSALNMSGRGLRNLGSINSARAGIYDLSAAHRKALVRVDAVYARRIILEDAWVVEARNSREYPHLKNYDFSRKLRQSDFTSQ